MKCFVLNDKGMVRSIRKAHCGDGIGIFCLTSAYLFRNNSPSVL